MPRREPPTTLQRGFLLTRALHNSPAKRHTFSPPYTGHARNHSIPGPGKLTNSLTILLTKAQMSESKSDLVTRSRKNSCQLTVRVLFGELSDGYANQNPRSQVFGGRGLGDLPHGFEATPKAHRASPTTPSPARPRSAFRTATSPARFHSLPARPDSAAVDNRNCRLPIRSETCGEPGSSL